jgi:hypothetical protein
MGYSALPGWRVNLEFDFIDQDQLRSGTDAISPTQVAPLNSPIPHQEIERQTINRYWNLGVAYSPNPDWSVLALIPYIDRSHTTYGNATPGELVGSQISGADATGLGDVKLIGNYQGILPTHNLGIQFGIKLPTGDYGGQNVNSGALVGRDPTLFTGGPNRGSALDTSLNPGTGSTDLIVGAYYYQAVSQNFDAFINGQFQSAISEQLDQSGANFRPGNQESMSFGVRYEANPDWVPQLQVNLTHKSSDQGALADTTDTSGVVSYLSPGMTVALGHGLHGYGFIQLPIYSKLGGYQLFPRWTATLGVSYAF